MTRKYVTISFISALGAFGLIHLVFSLIGSYGYLMGISGAFIVFALSVLTMAAGFRRRTAVLLIFFMTFPTALLLSYGTLYQSALSASIPFIQNLNEAYNLDMEVPKLLIRFSPLPGSSFTVRPQGSDASSRRSYPWPPFFSPSTSASNRRRFPSSFWALMH